MKKTPYLLMAALFFLCACGTQTINPGAEQSATVSKLSEEILQEKVEDVVEVKYDDKLIPELTGEATVQFKEDSFTNDLSESIKEEVAIAYTKSVNKKEGKMIQTIMKNTTSEDYLILCLAEDEETAKETLDSYFGEEAKTFEYYEEGETIGEYAQKYYRYIENVFTDKYYGSEDDKGTPKFQSRKDFSGK